MAELAEVTKAIEASNAAFAEFKRINDDRLAKIEKGEAGAGDLKVQMEKAFKDMADQKAVIETLEAKMKRPNIGGDGKPLDEVAEAHKKAFRGYITKGAEYDRAIEQKALNISAGTDGGFAVPKVVDSMIEDLIVDISPIRSIATVQQIGTSDFHKLVNRRGVSSGWVGETQTRTETNTPVLADVTPPLGELYANAMASQQMLDDVFFNAESWLADNIATEFARAEGAAFVSGTGVNQPMGFLAGPTPVATADSSRAFGTLEMLAVGQAAFDTTSTSVNPSDDLITIMSKLKAGYRQGSVWVMNKLTLFACAAMKDSVGRYIFNPSTAPGVPQSLLGYPVIEAEDMPNYTTSGAFAVAFGNFKRGYLIVDRIGTRVIRDVFSNKPYVGFYVSKRTGGGIVNSECIKLLKFSS